MKKIINVNTCKELEEVLISDNWIIYFFGDDCPNCIAGDHEIGLLANKNLINVARVYVTGETELTKKYQILSLPTIIMIKNNHEIGKVSGFQPLEVLEYYIKDKYESKE